MMTIIDIKKRSVTEKFFLYLIMGSVLVAINLIFRNSAMNIAGYDVLGSNEIAYYPDTVFIVGESYNAWIFWLILGAVTVFVTALIQGFNNYEKGARVGGFEVIGLFVLYMAAINFIIAAGAIPYYIDVWVGVSDSIMAFVWFIGMVMIGIYCNDGDREALLQ